MPAVNLRFEDLRARDNQKIDRDFFNKRYRLIAEAIMAVAKEVDGVAEDSDNLVSLGLVRVNEVLGPLLAKVQAASEEGFLVAESATSVQLSVGLQTTFEITAGWQRDLFQPTPYVMLSRQGGSVDDWALFRVDTYDRDNGGMAGEVVAVNGVIDAAAHADWVVSATAGIAKAVMEQAAAAQVAIDDAQAAAAAAEQAAAVLAEGPVSSVNGQTGTVALGIGDIPDLTTQLGSKAASNHGHAIEKVTGLQAALDGKAATVHPHTLSNITDAGSAAASQIGDFATAAQGALADTAQQPPVEGAFVDGDKTKLNGIEAGADVTDTANVTAAGALMDSEVTNLAQVKAFNSADYATAAQGTTADAALARTGGTMTGNLTLDEVTETVYSLTGTSIDPANGTVQHKTFSANTTFTEALVDGQSVLLHLAAGASYTITWPTMTWVGGSAPTLTADDVVVIWQRGTTVYGNYLGSVV